MSEQDQTPKQQTDDQTLPGQADDQTLTAAAERADQADAAEDQAVSGEQAGEQSGERSGEQPGKQVESPPAAEQDSPGQPAAAAKKPGRVLASLALLLALAGVGGVGYLYYLLVYQDPLARINAQQSEAQQNFVDMTAALSADMERLKQESDARLEALVTEQEQRLADNEAGVLKSLNEALQAAPPSQRKWKIAEAEYLLRIANHRVLMEQDSSGALNLLLAADAVIAELDDFSLHQVRARLADEIVALRQVRRDDLQGIYLRLEAVKGGLAELSFETPEYLADTVEEEPQQTVWRRLAAELEKFVRVRTLKSDETIKPLLAPEEEQFLELNLRLALQQAQTAALRRQQAVFDSSLQSARGWVADYMQQDEATQALLEELDDLLTVDLARPLPDISGSLNELLAANGGGT